MLKSNVGSAIKAFGIGSVSGWGFKFNLATLWAAEFSGPRKAKKRPTTHHPSAPTDTHTHTSQCMQSVRSKQLGQLVRAVKVLNFRIYGMPCIVIFTLIC